MKCHIRGSNVTYAQTVFLNSVCDTRELLIRLKTEIPVDILLLSFLLQLRSYALFVY